MPKSHVDHPQHHNMPQGHKEKKPASAILKITIFLGFIGLVIGALATGFAPLWMLAGAAAGVVGGFLIGVAIDRTLAKKKLDK